MLGTFYLPLLVSTFISYAFNFLIQARKFWQNEQETNTALNVSKYVTFSGPYFPVFGLNTERYGVSVRIQSECGKKRTRKTSVFGHFSRSRSDWDYKHSNNFFLGDKNFATATGILATLNALTLQVNLRYLYILVLIWHVFCKKW